MPSAFSPGASLKVRRVRRSNWSMDPIRFATPNRSSPMGGRRQWVNLPRWQSWRILSPSGPVSFIAKPCRIAPTSAKPLNHKGRAAAFQVVAVDIAVIHLEVIALPSLVDIAALMLLTSGRPCRRRLATVPPGQARRISHSTSFHPHLHFCPNPTPLSSRPAPGSRAILPGIAAIRPKMVAERAPKR